MGRRTVNNMRWREHQRNENDDGSVATTTTKTANESSTSILNSLCYSCRICQADEAGRDKNENTVGYRCEICERLQGSVDDDDVDDLSTNEEEEKKKKDEEDHRGKRRSRLFSRGFFNASSKLEPLAMDCGRRQSDVGQWLRCASSVVRWRRFTKSFSFSFKNYFNASSSSSTSSSSSSSSSSPSSSSSSSSLSSTTTTRRPSCCSSSSVLLRNLSTINVSTIFFIVLFIANLNYASTTSAHGVYDTSDNRYYNSNGRHTQHFDHAVRDISSSSSSSSAVAAAASSSSSSTSSSAKRTVCQSVDVRNSVNQFSRLEGCRVVEGFVQILLIDHANDTSYANLTFPDLVEITGYLLLYRVNGLRSVGHLFPNLTVIRGHSLFINYALVAFEMMHLQEIGLHSLTNIGRGSVRFEKNPALCYVDTIDWDLIIGVGKGEHVISGNKPRNGCPVCEKHCPTRSTKKDETLCWNRQYCQHVCDKSCGISACNNSMPGKCCHSSCLGSCTGTGSQDCAVCRDVIVDGNRCANSCPENTYMFLNRRCVQENECRKMKKPREAFDIVKEHPYKPFNNTCVIECPPGYMDEEVNGKATCKKCDGLCLKECSGTNVDSIASAQKLRGCTHITGSLEIQIRGGKNIVKELEDSLSMIEEIDGYLKIVRSFPLISLNFLKNLHTIHGKELESGKYTFVVLDNQNLQELWDMESHKSMRILANNGPVKVFFHFNPKLCLDTIEKFRKGAGLPEFSDLEVAPNSNGDKVACNVTKLHTRVQKKTSNAALIAWEPFDHHDQRSLLGYVVYFIEAPNNVTMYDGRDACGGDGWRVDDVSAAESSDRTIHQNGTDSETTEYYSLLTQLKPYTQYAFYVKTYTIATERSGAQSDLHYFTTDPDAPSVPRSLYAYSNASNELVITWEPPLHKNGNLTHYRIIGRWEKDDRAFLDQRNYCNEPLNFRETKPMTTPDEAAHPKPTENKRPSSTNGDEIETDDSKCKCIDDKDLREKEVSSSIAFEDALHNQVYVKRPSSDRRRRDVSEIVKTAKMWQEQNVSYSYPEDKDNALTDDMVNGSISLFNRTVYGQTNYAVKNLRHYAVYTIEVQACREPVPNESQSNYCSTKSIKTARTEPLISADDIPNNTFDLEVITGNNSRSMVKLSWEEPPNPNGLIVTYQIEYKKIDFQNVKAMVICIPWREFVDDGHVYVLNALPPGNYSLRLRATSLYGNGAYTVTKHFYIEELNAGGSHPYLWPLLSVFILSVLILGGGYALKRKFMPNSSEMRLFATVNPEYVSTVYVPDDWEVPRKKIELLRELGNGSFGMVYEGVAKDVVKGKPEVKCAVKTVNENATDRERIEFLNEASVMKAFNTHHVVRLLGVVSVGQPTLVVMELMVNGDLKTYLRSHRPDVCENFSKQPPTLKRILQMAIEIADGMSYLSAKKFVHRDLAARNCMVAEDMTVKIGDFGMTRDIYETDYYRKGTKGLLPVRWMAPESLKDGVFTSYSDVWSYGVVLWEMVTLASQPYQGLSNDQVLRYVIDGGVMERPENCPDSLYNLMRRTWNHKPNQRPTFIDIATMLLTEVNVETFERVSFYHSPEGIEARNQNASHSPQTDKDLEMETLRNLQDEEADQEGSEESPLREDFGDFASFEPSGPNSIKISSNPIYGATTRNDNSKVSPNFHEFNSSKVPLKADFDDFEGASMESLRSSRDTLDLPFAEDSLKSVKNSPFVDKRNNSRVNSTGDNSVLGKNSINPNNVVKRNFSESPRFSKIKSEDPDYENKSPEVFVTSGDTIKNTNVHRVEFPSIDGIDDKNINDNGGNKSKVDYKSNNKQEGLNNGYISGKTTQC